MHRSGTSMIAQLLKECGLYLGPSEKIRNASPDNPDGYWEHPGFVAINNQILEEFGGGWDLVPNFPADWKSSVRLQAQRKNSEELIKQFQEHEVWGWKDPRNSITLPFWNQQIRDLKIVIVVRNPVSVARSLAARGIASYSFSTTLWLNYYFHLMKGAASQEHIITHYDSYFLDPAAELRRIVNFIGMPVSEDVLHGASTIIKTRLRNNPAKLIDLLSAHTAQDVIEKYVELCSSCGPVYQAIADQELSEAGAGLENGEASFVSTFKSKDIKSVHIAFLQNAIRESSQHLAEFKRAGQTSNERILKRDQKITALQTQLSGKEQALQRLSSQLLEHDHAIASARAQLTERQRIIAERDEGITYLRGQLQLSADDVFRMRTSRIWRLGIFYRAWRDRFYGLLFPLLHPIEWMRRIFQNRSAKQTGPPVVAPSAPIPEPAVEPDFYEALPILPGIPGEWRSIVINHEMPLRRVRQPDVICFSIIDWNFRYQRPQQMMSQFALHGHRVFYICISEFLSSQSSPRVMIRNIKENVYEVVLAVERQPDVYGELIDGENLDALIASLDELRHTYKIEEAISYVAIASWSAVALMTKKRWDWRVVYDCMDEWNNFPLIQRAIIDAEIDLVQACDLLVLTSQRLYENWEKYERPMVLVRNATDYEFYSQHFHPNQILTDAAHPIIGYYGAIADWFDVELMIYIATERPNYTFILLGGVFDVDVLALQSLSNVRLLGQQPYELMPQYLYHFDVCIIPFKISPVTEAVDPVKIYEYLCGGKPVVSVDLPELHSYRELLYIAQNKEDFLVKLDLAATEDDQAMIARRKAFARENSWAKRYEAILAGITGATPLASITVVSYNNLELTKLCLESILLNTDYPNYEIIVVDNHSSDGTQAYLRYMTSIHENLHILLNPGNHGFAKANNQGLAQAAGEYLVLLNNDTIVPPGWLGRLIRHLHDLRVGLVGPVTNFVGNEAKINVNYKTWSEMETFARDHTWKNENLVSEIHMLAMYCVALRRDVYETVGPLDEQFGVGLFEDDDYMHRLRQAGYQLLCAQDVFIHHFGQASFIKLIHDGSYDQVFEKNRRHYEQKWDVTWKPHQHRPVIPFLHEFEPGQTAGQGASEYEQKILRENIKWGEHLKVEASGQWNAWLDHPLVLAHYQQRASMDGRRWEEWIKKYMDGPAEKSLDLGCGAGARSLFLWEAGSSRYIEGADVSRARVAEGEKRRQAMGAPGKFRVGDINRLGLPAQSYDLIFSCHSFHHFLELEMLMEQVSQGLTDRGLFVLEEFVGPTQFQWTDLQIKLTRELLSTLPASLRTFRDGRVKNEEGRPSVDQVVAASPFESIRSAEIWPLFQKHFEVVAVRKIGGTIQHLLYNGIIHNFSLDDQNASGHIQRIYEAEDSLIDSGEIPSDFLLIAGRRRR
jgi:GT2 family glycosyltransferase/SAM-dependent methyltransferase/glycosyltransferase involved in cell wall biosynthesis